MSENNTDSASRSKDIIDATTGLIKAIPVYDDLLQPSMREAGKSLKIIVKSINVALAPIKGLVWGYEQLEEFFSLKLQAN